MYGLHVGLPNLTSLQPDLDVFGLQPWFERRFFKTPRCAVPNLPKLVGALSQQGSEAQAVQRQHLGKDKNDRHEMWRAAEMCCRIQEYDVDSSIRV